MRIWKKSKTFNAYLSSFTNLFSLNLKCEKKYRKKPIILAFQLHSISVWCCQWCRNENNQIWVNLRGRWNYIHAAFSAVHPFGCANPLVVRCHVVKTCVEMENKHQVSNSANDSLREQKRVMFTMIHNSGSQPRLQGSTSSPSNTQGGVLKHLKAQTSKNQDVNWYHISYVNLFPQQLEKSGSFCNEYRFFWPCQTFKYFSR